MKSTPKLRSKLYCEIRRATCEPNWALMITPGTVKMTILNTTYITSDPACKNLAMCPVAAASAVKATTKTLMATDTARLHYYFL